MLNSVSGELRDVDQSVDLAQVDEGAKGRQRFHSPRHHLTRSELAERSSAAFRL